MSSLTNAIKFRHLFAQLNVNECNQLLFKLTAKYGTNFIGSLLFNSWSPNAKSIISNDQMTYIVQMISNIMQLRDNLPNTNNFKIDTINHQLIGEIASYLSYKDHSTFSECNRAIYIGCNSPNSLQEIGYAFNINYSLIHLSKYSSLKMLYFPLRKFDDFHLPSNGTVILNNLANICLEGNEGNPMVDITSFESQNCINFNRIEMLSLDLFNNDDAFWKLLRRFGHKLKYLQLSDIQTYPDETPFVVASNEEIKALFPNLEQLRCANIPQELAQKLIYFYGANLKHLDLDMSDDDLFLDSVNFKILDELILYEPTEQRFDNIIKTANSLTKCKIDFTYVEEKDLIQNVARKVMLSQKGLKCVQFDINDNYFQYICNGIEQGLLMTKQIKRKYLKIGIEVGGYPEIQIDEVLLFMSRIKDKLKLSIINDYTFFVRLENWKVDKKELDDAINQFEDIYQDIIVRNVVDEHDKRYTNVTIVLMNKNCKINGYSTSFTKYYSWCW